MALCALALGVTSCSAVNPTASLDYVPSRLPIGPVLVGTWLPAGMNSFRFGAEDRALPVPGANDGASGTAVLLELARLFREQAPPVGVDLLFVDGEDFGPSTDDMFLGARHYADEHAVDEAPLFGVLLDMVGDADPLFPVEAYSAEAAPEVVQRVWSVAQQLGFRRYFPLEASQRVVDDHLPLNDAGIPTINIIDFDYGPGNGYWHTPDDVPSNTSPETLRMVGEVVAELVYRQR